MKKLLFAAVLLLGTITMSAANYTNSVGGTAGTMYGFTYKGFVFGVDGLALQLDLGLNLPALAGKAVTKTKTTGMGMSNTTTSKSDFMFGDFLEFQVNPNIVFQSEISSWGWGSLDWFIGGGLSVGLLYQYGDIMYKGELTGNEWKTISRQDMKDMGQKEKDFTYGKFGLNAIGGIELGWKKIPLAVGVDFRPGYGLGFKTDKQKEGGIETKTTDLLHFFDWALVASVRYCF